MDTGRRDHLRAAADLRRVPCQLLGGRAREGHLGRDSSNGRAGRATGTAAPGAGGRRRQLRGLGEARLNAEEQGLQRDGSGDGDHDAADRPGRRARAELQSADRELPGQGAARDASGGGLDQPGQQRGDARQQQEHPDGGQQHALGLLDALRGLQCQGQHPQPDHWQQRPPPESALPRTAAADRPERVQRYPVHRQLGHRDRQCRDHDHHQRRDHRLRADVLGVEAEPLDAEVLQQPTADQEEEQAKDQAQYGSAERLPGGNPRGHPPVRAGEPQRGEPPVALVAAEAGGRAHEDHDRGQHHHEPDQDQQHQQRIQRFAGEGVPELVDPDRAVGEGEAVAADDVRQLGGAEQSRLADGADRRVVQPRPQQSAAVRPQQARERGGDHHLSRPRVVGHARRERGVGALRLHRPPPDVLPPEDR